MPELVSLFNAAGGGAAALVAVHDFLHFTESPGAHILIPLALDVLIGAVTFSGSLIASGKLHGVVPGQPIVFPGARVLTLALAAVMLVTTVMIAAGVGGLAAVVILGLAALAFGVTMVLPIGGADMPVVISLLNAFTGLAAAAAGVALDNTALIVAGMLVGCSGTILTQQMAQAMNRSIGSIIAGGFGGGGGSAAASADTSGGTVRATSAADAAIQMAYARQVIVVPGYGMAVSQAQHAVREMTKLLEEKGVTVKFAIHPVAGRMPGHMNVLLAEADVPYDQLKEMDEINGEFGRTDVSLVIGANDVTNPDARNKPDSPIYGMPILNVDESQSIIVLKRSMSAGYAGIDNPLFTNPKTSMLFGDAKQSVENIIEELKAL